jgi:hypothetical protein
VSPFPSCLDAARSLPHPPCLLPLAGGGPTSEKHGSKKVRAASHSPFCTAQPVPWSYHHLSSNSLARMTFGCRIFFAALFSFTSSSSVSETSPFLSSSSHRHHQHSRRQQQHNHNSYHNKRQHPPPHDRHILTVGSLDGGGSGGGSGRSSIAALAAFRGGSSGQQRRTATATKTTASTIATNEAKEEATVTLPAGFALTATAAANSNQSFSGGYHHDAGEVVWKEDPSQVCTRVTD